MTLDTLIQHLSEIRAMSGGDALVFYGPDHSAIRSLGWTPKEFSAIDLATVQIWPSLP